MTPIDDDNMASIPDRSPPVTVLTRCRAAAAAAAPDIGLEVDALGLNSADGDGATSAASAGVDVDAAVLPFARASLLALPASTVRRFSMAVSLRRLSRY